MYIYSKKRGTTGEFSTAVVLANFSHIFIVANADVSYTYKKLSLLVSADTKTFLISDIKVSFVFSDAKAHKTQDTWG